MITRRDFVRCVGSVLALAPLHAAAGRLEEFINSSHCEKPLLVYNLELPLDRPQKIMTGHAYFVDCNMVATAHHILRPDSVTLLYSPYTGAVDAVEPVGAERDILLARTPYSVSDYPYVCKHPPEDNEYVYSVSYEHTDHMATELCEQVLGSLELKDGRFLQNSFVFQNAYDLGISRHIGRSMYTGFTDLYAVRAKAKKGYSGSPVFDLEHRLRGIVVDRGALIEDRQAIPLAVFASSAVIRRLMQKL